MTLVNWLFLHRIFKLFVIFYPFPAGSGSGVNACCPLITGLVVRSLPLHVCSGMTLNPSFAWRESLDFLLSGLYRAVQVEVGAGCDAPCSLLY